MQEKTSVVILAAGYSSRMKQLKLSLRLSSGITFLENIINQYVEFGCDEIIVVINKDGKEYLENNPINYTRKIKFALNEHPENERFFSIKTGLSTLNKGNIVFIHNVDNPFISQKTLNLIYFRRLEADWIKPVFKNRGGHPILISNKIAQEIVSTKEFNIHLNHFLENYSCKPIEVEDDKILLNVNTQKDYLNL